MTELTDEEIVARVTYADKWIQPFRNNDREASKAYISVNDTFGDSDNLWSDNSDSMSSLDEADVPKNIPVGEPNYATINNEIKIRAVGTNCPKLHIKANENPKKPPEGTPPTVAAGWKPGCPGAPSIVQEAWSLAYDKWDYGREFMAAWQKYGICGLACLWYRWDIDDGFQIEDVTTNRLFFDPHATSFSKLRYAGVKIRIPLKEALDRYDPDGKKEVFSTNTSGLFSPENTNKERTVVTILIYWDKREEIHLYNDKVISRNKNLYKKIPLEFRLGIIDPNDKLLPLGDNVISRGLNQQIVDLASIASSVAKHGGPITVADGNYFSDPQQQQALQNGASKQVLVTDKPLNPGALPIHRIPGENLSPAFGVSLAITQGAFDAAMGTSEAMRGQSMPGETATANVMTAKKSGAMQIYMTKQFERMCTRIATEFVFCSSEFGGPVKDNKASELPVSVQLWEAFRAVMKVRVIPGSTGFVNSGMDLQEAMQRYTATVTSLQAWLELAAKGAVTKIPKMARLFEDMLAASGVDDPEEYWEDAPPPPKGPMAVPPDIVKALQTVYADVPPDVQRQIEQVIGLEPSKTGHPPEQQEADHAVTAMKAELAMTQSKIAAEHKQQESDHIHEMRMVILEMQKDLQLLQAQLALRAPAEKEKPNKKKETE